MEREEKEHQMSKFNRALWYIMGILTFVIVLVVVFAMFWRGSGY